MLVKATRIADYSEQLTSPRYTYTSSRAPIGRSHVVNGLYEKRRRMYNGMLPPFNFKIANTFQLPTQLSLVGHDPNTTRGKDVNILTTSLRLCPILRAVAHRRRKSLPYCLAYVSDYRTFLSNPREKRKTYLIRNNCKQCTLRHRTFYSRTQAMSSTPIPLR